MGSWADEVVWRMKGESGGLFGQGRGVGGGRM